VQPRIEGLEITPIPLGNGRNAYVLTILQAATRAPHQAPDGKYYKRQNFQSVPMEDYEVRDTLRRATTPELHVDLQFGTGPLTDITFSHAAQLSNPITIGVTVTNKSPQPAFHAIVEVGVDATLPLRTPGKFHPLGHQQQQYWLGQQFSSPPGTPIFKEMSGLMNLHADSFTIAVPSAMLASDEQSYCVTTSVQTPGHSATEHWVIHRRGLMLELCPPGHPRNPHR
jgi:hypothetical protein